MKLPGCDETLDSSLLLDFHMAVQEKPNRRGRKGAQKNGVIGPSEFLMSPGLPTCGVKEKIPPGIRAPGGTTKTPMARHCWRKAGIGTGIL
jgi:hypothetical protein